MRCSSLSGFEHCAIRESPILPFLAPRVFAPWLYPPRYEFGQRCKHRTSSSCGLTSELSKNLSRSCCDGTLLAGATSFSVKEPSSRSYHVSTACRALARNPAQELRRADVRVKKQARNGATRESYSPREQNLLDLHGSVSKGIDTKSLPSTNGATLSQSPTTAHPYSTLEWAQRADTRRRRVRLQRGGAALRADIIGRPQRTKYASLRPQRSGLGEPESDHVQPLHHFSTGWTSAVAKLAARFDKKLHTDPEINILFGADEKSWAEDVPTNMTMESLRTHWQCLPSQLRVRRWAAIVLFHLQASPLHALNIVHATLESTLPASYQLKDALDLVAANFLQRPERYSKTDVELFDSTVQKIRKLYHRRFPFSHRVIRFLARYGPPPTGEALEHQESTHHNTLLHVATSLAKRKEHASALKVLQQAAKAGADVSSVGFTKTCSTLLRYSGSGMGNYQDSSGLIACFFEMGVRLNIVMYNILILNASEAGDPGTAWRIYNMIRQNGVQPDEYTYTILMKMCRSTNDRTAYRALYYEFRPERKELRPATITEILACRSHFNERSNYDHVLRFYERHCDLQPLRDIGIVPFDYQSRHLGSRHCLPLPRPSPCGATLAFMVSTFLRQEQKLQYVSYIYERFRQSLRDENPCIVPLAASNHTYHAFLKAFGKSHGTLARWRDVVRDMVTPLPSHVKNRETGTSVQPLKATAHTWNIIVNALVRDGQDDVAQKLVLLMEQNDMVPNIVTWNSLINGSARDQKFMIVADILQRMEEAGTPPDGQTREALLFLKHHSRLMETLAARKTGTRPEYKIADSNLRLVRSKDRNMRRQRNPSQGGNGIAFYLSNDPPRRVGRFVPKLRGHNERRSRQSVVRSRYSVVRLGKRRSKGLTSAQS